MTPQHPSAQARIAAIAALIAIVSVFQMAPVRAARSVTDGWMHSSVGTSSQTYQATDGWLHSTVARSLDAPATATDGWVVSKAVLEARGTTGTTVTATDGWAVSKAVLERGTTGTQLAAVDGLALSRDILETRRTTGTTVAATDGWMGSIVGDQARAAEATRIVEAPSQTSGGYGYIDDFALGSGLLNLILLAGAVIFLVRQRSKATTF